MRIYKQAETFAVRLGGEEWREHYKDYTKPREIVFTPEEQEQRGQLKDELHRRVDKGQIQPLDAMNPQSMTDTHDAYNDLFYDPNDGMVRRPA